ncbi:unnamed protein product, partial [Rotaria sp. Silwood2]
MGNSSGGFSLEVFK